MTATLHRLMRYVVYHIVNFGCFLRGCPEENESDDKHFKQLVQLTNRHIDTMASKLLTNWV